MVKYETKSGYRRFRYNPELRAAGLLHHLVDGAAAFQIQGLEAEELEPTRAALAQEGWLLSGERLAWNAPATAWLMNAFPKAINLRSYNHGLSSPTTSVVQAKVVIREITTTNGHSARTDGSGRIHPNHPLAWGQFRAGSKGDAEIPYLFGKGMLFPDERCVDSDGNPAIWIDPSNLKGVHKGLREGQTMMTLGLIREFKRSSRLRWGFEVLENIPDTSRSRELIGLLLEEAIDGISTESLLRQVSDNDEKMDLLIKVLQGVNVNPLSCSTVYNAVNEKLQRKKYHLAQGCGYRSPSYVICHDAGVARGSVVVRGLKHGTKVAAFRMPNVLQQGLRVYEVQKPLPHHLVDGAVSENIVFMNPDDVFVYHQGDDDGDTIAIDPNPIAVELFSMAMEAAGPPLLIEPDGKKFDTPSDSVEGRQYISRTPMGPVGVPTMWRAAFLAAGDHAAADAMSLCIQECIDQAKNLVQYSDYVAAAEPNNWVPSESGLGLTFKRRLDPDSYTPGEVPLDKIGEWVKKRLAAAGVPKGASVLGWRAEGKRIADNSLIDDEWSGGNLVHYCARRAQYLWGKKGLRLDGETVVDPGEALIVALAAVGVVVEPTKFENWKSYLPLREQVGLKGLGSRMARISRDIQDDPSKRAAAMQTALDEWYADPERATTSLQEVVDAWCMEWSSEGNSNHAVRLVSATAAGKMAMSLLGIEPKSDCSFLTPGRALALNNWFLRQEDPFRALVERVMNSTAHGREVQDPNGHPVPVVECDCCMGKLTLNLLRVIRSDRGRDDRVVMNQLVTKLNQA
jgi:hypothetical protein